MESSGFLLPLCPLQTSVDVSAALVSDRRSFSRHLKDLVFKGNQFQYDYKRGGFYKKTCNV